MTTLPAYERDPYLRELATEVVEIGVADGRPFALLADTVLYAEGGGQPADRGWLGEVGVLDVQRHGAAVRHFLEQPVGVGPTAVRLDWARRFDHMQQHTAQHLLTAVADDRFGWPTTAFHLGAQVSDIEIAAPSLPDLELRMLEEAVAAEIRSARRVTSRGVSPEVLATLAVRTRGLPAGHEGDVRLVEIEGVDLNTCGGTHLRSTAEIEAIKLLGGEPMRGGLRLHWVAGGRVRGRLAAHEARCARLRVLLGAPDDELPEVAELKLGQLHAAERRIRGLEEALASASAGALAGGRNRVVAAHFDDVDVAFLQRVGRLLAAAAPAKVALLTASQEGKSFFAVVAGEAVTFDVQAAGREVAELFAGRGGGSGRVFQGRAGSLAARDAAVARLSELVPES